MGNRNGLHDRRGGLTVGCEAIDDFFEVLDVADVGGHDVAVISSYPLAVDDLRGALGELADLLQLSAGGSDTDHGGESHPQLARVQARVVTEDHVFLLQAL